MLRGVSVLRPSHLLTDLHLPEGKAKSRLAAMADFNALCSSGSGYTDPSSAEPPFNRLRLVLQALDGFLAGASQREIAEALFGFSRVRSEWRDTSGYMRDRVRRAVKRGRDLMMKDYLSLLG